jgi:hypothetical protein
MTGMSQRRRRGGGGGAGGAQPIGAPVGGGSTAPDAVGGVSAAA